MTKNTCMGHLPDAVRTVMMENPSREATVRMPAPFTGDPPVCTFCTATVCFTVA